MAIFFHLSFLIDNIVVMTTIWRNHHLAAVWILTIPLLIAHTANGYISDVGSMLELCLMSIPFQEWMPKKLKWQSLFISCDQWSHDINNDYHFNFFIIRNHDIIPLMSHNSTCQLMTRWSPRPVFQRPYFPTQPCPQGKQDHSTYALSAHNWKLTTFFLLSLILVI